jgi:hypothetical protein
LIRNDLAVLAAVGTQEYDQRLPASLGEAEAVMALNPVTGAMLEPFSSRVGVVSGGMDRARFPWPPPEVSEPGRPTAGTETKTLTTQHPFPPL